MLALAAGLAELTGGALLALGLLAPLAAALLITVMVTAVATDHWQNGEWVTEGGFEYNIVRGAIAFGVTATGAGKWSLDHRRPATSRTLAGLRSAALEREGHAARPTRARWSVSAGLPRALRPPF